MKKRILLISLVVAFCFSLSTGVWAEENAESNAVNADASLRAAYYTPSSAVNYANSFALSPNSYYKNYISTNKDCTNYISQCIFSGGVPQDTTWRYTLYYDPTGTRVKYLDNDSTAWSEANYFKNWLTRYATKVGSWSRFGTPEPYKTYSYLGANDSANITGSGRYIVFYDWTGDGYMDHVAICVATGRSQTAQDGNVSGDLINQHSTERYKAIWHADNRNAYNTTTRIYAFKITY